MSEVGWEVQRRATLRQSLGVGIATGAYGVGFGALGVAAGLSATQTCALSVLAFTGASQFALTGVIGSGGDLFSGSGTAVLLGSRNTLYGLRLAGLLGVRRGWRLVAAQLVIDESTAVTLGQPTPRTARLGFWATGVSVFVLWNLATLIGALGGEALADAGFTPEALGLDAAAPAAFIALLAPRLRGQEAFAVAVVAALVGLALVPVAPAGVPVMAAALVAVFAGLRRRNAGSSAGAGAGAGAGR